MECRPLRTMWVGKRGVRFGLPVNRPELGSPKFLCRTAKKLGALLDLLGQLGGRAVGAAVQAADLRFGVCVKDHFHRCQAGSISSKLHLKGESTAFELRVEQEVGLDGEDTSGFAVNSVEDDGSADLSRVVGKREGDAGQAIEATVPYPKRGGFGRLSYERDGDKGEGATEGDGYLLHDESSFVHDLNFVTLCLFGGCHRSEGSAKTHTFDCR